MAKKKVKKEKPSPLFPKATKKSSAKFVSLSITAVIPVQSYGNIQPKIEVTAKTYEEARAFAMPLIEELYAHYAESKPGFLGKVQVTEKVVAPAAPVAQPSTVATPAHTQVENAKPKSEAVLKAEKAISLAMTEDAAERIQDQIEKSVKIAKEDKPALLELCLKKRSALSK